MEIKRETEMNGYVATVIVSDCLSFSVIATSTPKNNQSKAIFNDEDGDRQGHKTTTT